jgi:hypothetical protein
MALAAASASADDWGNLATISSTLGVNANRLCLGEGLRASDIGCPTYAPYVTSTGYVGIGTNNPVFKLHMSAAGGNVDLGLDRPTTSDLTRIMYRTGGTTDWSVGIRGSSSDYSIYNEQGAAAGQLFTIRQATGNVGIATSTPQATLQVSGSMIVSVTGQITSPSLYVATNGKVGIGITAPTAMFEAGVSGTHALIWDPANAYGPGRELAWFMNGSPAVGFRQYASTNAVDLFFQPNTYSLGGAGSSIGPTNDIRSLGFYTSNGTTLVERMRIASNTYVGVGTQSPTAHLEVSGTISATNFVGNGSGLTGVTAGSSDRITSGTTSMVAISNTGYVSLTQNGVNTGWFNPSTGFVTIGVSSTGPISGTNGYFSGNVGIGTAFPVNPLEVAGAVVGQTFQSGQASNSGVMLGQYQVRGYNSLGGNPFTLGSASNDSGDNVTNVFMRSAGLIVWGGDTGVSRLAAGKVGIGSGAQGSTAGTLIAASVGIGTITPTAKLDVVGTISASDVIQVSGSALACASSINGAMRWSAPSDTLQICTGGGWKSLTSGTTSGVVAAGVSGSIQFNNGASALAGRSDIVIDSTGQVAIGTSNPSATLEVSGTLKLAGGTGAEVCDPDHYGQIRRNPTTGAFQICASR